MGYDKNCHHDYLNDQWEDDSLIKAINRNAHESTDDNSTHNRCHRQEEGGIACGESRGEHDGTTDEQATEKAADRVEASWPLRFDSKKVQTSIWARTSFSRRDRPKTNNLGLPDLEIQRPSQESPKCLDFDFEIDIGSHRNHCDEPTSSAIVVKGNDGLGCRR